MNKWLFTFYAMNKWLFTFIVVIAVIVASVAASLAYSAMFTVDVASIFAFLTGMAFGSIGAVIVVNRFMDY